MPIATAALGFVVMFFFGSMTGHLASQPKQIGKTIVTQENQHVRFYNIVDSERIGTGPEMNVRETVNECVCKEKAPKLVER